MEIFKKRQFSFLLQLISLTIVVLGMHFYLMSYFTKSSTFFFPVWHIYVFHAMVTASFYTIINYQFSKGKKNVFNLFLGLTLFKMFLAILFLLPLILSDFENKQRDVFSFFIPYFLYLFFEVFSVTKFLQKS
jgi:hypothetical protein